MIHCVNWVFSRCISTPNYIGRCVPSQPSVTVCGSTACLHSIEVSLMVLSYFVIPCSSGGGDGGQTNPRIRSQQRKQGTLCSLISFVFVVFFNWSVRGGAANILVCYTLYIVFINVDTYALISTPQFIGLNFLLLLLLRQVGEFKSPLTYQTKSLAIFHDKWVKWVPCLLCMFVLCIVLFLWLYVHVQLLKRYTHLLFSERNICWTSDISRFTLFIHHTY